MRHFPSGEGLASPVALLAPGMEAASSGALLIASTRLAQVVLAGAGATAFSAVDLASITRRAEVDAPSATAAKETSTIGARGLHGLGGPGLVRRGFVILEAVRESSQALGAGGGGYLELRCRLPHCGSPILPVPTSTPKALIHARVGSIHSCGFRPAQKLGSEMAVYPQDSAFFGHRSQGSNDKMPEKTLLAIVSAD